MTIILSRQSLIVPLLFLTVMAPAQNFGIKAGINMSAMTVNESTFFTFKDSYRMNTGFHAGAVSEIRVFDLLLIESGLYLTSKGCTGESEEVINNNNYNIYEKKVLYFLDAPLMLKVPFSIGKLKLYGSAGGYASIGLAGNSMISREYYGNFPDKIEWESGEKPGDLKRFDYGLMIGTGVSVDPIQLGVSYSMGLANMSPESNSGAEISNSVLGISLAYMFGRNSKKDQVPIETKIEPEKTETTPSKKQQAEKMKRSSRKKAEIEAERQRVEKIRNDSIAFMAEKERIRQEEERIDSMNAARARTEKAEAERIRLEKLKADSIALKKAATIKQNKDVVIYRVQFASSTTKKGSYNIKIADKNYSTWEYFYSGAYRSTAGEFKTLAAARAFQNVMRKSGYPDAFVVAFRDNVRSLDPSLFK